MKVFLIAIIAGCSIFGQQPEPTPTEKELLAKMQLLMIAMDKQSRQIDQQSRQIARIESQPKEPQHRKAVTIMLRVLTVIDHAGSVASVYSVVPH